MENVVVRSSERALLYYAPLSRAISWAEQRKGIDLSAILQGLIDELDQLYLPAFVESIGKTKGDAEVGSVSLDELFSRVPRAPWIKAFHAKYSFLSELANIVVAGTLSAVDEALSRYEDVIERRQEVFFAHTPVKRVELLSDADRHNFGRRVLSIENWSGDRVVYKPTNGWNERALYRAAEVFELDDLKPCLYRSLLGSDSNGDYLFSPYIDHVPCTTDAEVMSFYSRIGQMLALTQALGCSDIHCGNVIASGAHPYIIDSECHFQNFSLHPQVRFDLHTTLLIQRLPDPEQMEFWLSGISANARYSYDALAPVVRNDNTTDIELELGEHSMTSTSNVPLLGDEYVSPGKYSAHVVDGYRKGLSSIRVNSRNLLQDNEFWKLLGRSRIRVVIRRTAAYYQAYRRLSMPDAAVDRTTALEMLHGYSRRFSALDSEIRQLMQADFPYFYTTLDSSHILDIYGSPVLTYPTTLRESLVTNLESLHTIDEAQSCTQIHQALELGDKIEKGDIDVYEPISHKLRAI